MNSMIICMENSRKFTWWQNSLRFFRFCSINLLDRAQQTYGVWQCCVSGCMKNVVLQTPGTVFKSPRKRLVLSPFQSSFCVVRSCPLHLHALEVVQLHLPYSHPLSQLGTGRGDFDRRLSDRSWWLCTTVGARLRQEGVDLVALDDWWWSLDKCLVNPKCRWVISYIVISSKG